MCCVTLKNLKIDAKSLLTLLVCALKYYFLKMYLAFEASWEFWVIYNNKTGLQPVLNHLNNHNKRQNQPAHMPHGETAEHLRNRQSPFYSEASHTRPKQPNTSGANLTLPKPQHT